MRLFFFPREQPHANSKNVKSHILSTSYLRGVWNQKQNSILSCKPKIAKLILYNDILFYDKEIISDLVVLSNFHLENKYFLLKMSFQLHTVEKRYKGKSQPSVGDLLKPCINYWLLSSSYLNEYDPCNHRLHFLCLLSAVAASSDQSQIPIIAVSVTVGVILLAVVIGFLLSGR